MAVKALFQSVAKKHVCVLNGLYYRADAINRHDC